MDRRYQNISDGPLVPCYPNFCSEEHGTVLRSSEFKNLVNAVLVSHHQSQRPINWAQLFGPLEFPKPLDVEIGSGLGEFLVQEARQHSNRNFVGIEQDGQRVKKILRKVSRASLVASNVRVLKVDAIVALERLFKPLAIDKVYCLFPCPWPKKRHIKHRLFSNDFLKLLNSRLVKKGEVQVVTDYLPYFDWIQEQLDGTGFKAATKMIQPRFDTKFERKWCQEGRKEFFELNLVKEKHIAVPLEEDAPLKVYFVDHFNPEAFHLSNVLGEVSIILKDFLFDPARQKAMLRVVVAEKSMTQHLWIAIVKCSSHLPRQRRGQGRGWSIAKAEGQMVLPTQGVALALRHVYETIK